VIRGEENHREIRSRDPGLRQRLRRSLFDGAPRLPFLRRSDSGSNHDCFTIGNSPSPKQAEGLHGAAARRAAAFTFGAWLRACIFSV
jgi:hypothetical protein